MQTKTTPKTKDLNNTFKTIAAIVLAIFLCMLADSISGNIGSENDTVKPISSTTQNF